MTSSPHKVSTIFASQTEEHRRPLKKYILPRKVIKKWPFAKNEKKVVVGAMPSQMKVPSSIATFSTGGVAVQRPEAVAVPVEVTVVGEFAANASRPDCGGYVMEKLEIAQMEAKEYLHQLRSTQDLLDQLTNELNRSRLQVAELIGQNEMLLKELQLDSGKDDANHDEHRMIKQEMTILKGCLFLCILFIFCGGRENLLSLIGLVWIVVGISA